MSLLSPNLQAFLAVKEQLTVAAAAHSIKLTQAAVTLRIQSLERELAVTLFERSRRGMRLTSAGEALARYCLRSQEIEAEILPNLKPGESAHATVKVTLQGPSSPMRVRVIPMLEEYLKKYPFVNLECRITDLESGIENLKRGSIDLLIAPRYDITKEFDSKILKPERYILVGSSAWKKRSVEDIVSTEKIIDFDPSDNMTFDFLKKYHLFKFARTDRHFVNLTESIAELVGEKLGYSVLSVETAEPLIKSGKLYNILPGKYFDFQLGIAWYSRKQMPKFFAELVKTIK